MKTLYSALLALGLLSACDSGPPPSDKPGEKQEHTADSAIRQEFSRRFSTQCMAQVPQDSEVMQSRAKLLCDCAAGQIVSQVSAADFTSLLSGNTQELQTKFAGVIRRCAQEQLMPPQASAPSPAGASEAEPDEAKHGKKKQLKNNAIQSTNTERDKAANRRQYG